MSELVEWLEARRPAPPDELVAAIREALVGVDVGSVDGSRASVLARAARRSLDAARARPGRVRASAFELLVADALLTYAAEAALESGDADAELRGLVAVGRAP